MSFTSASIRSLRRAPSTTRAPFCASSFAVLAPMPLLAPVMTTTFSATPDIPIVGLLAEAQGKRSVSPVRVVRRDSVFAGPPGSLLNLDFRCCNLESREYYRRVGNPLDIQAVLLQVLME